jgi:uncharacterized protein YbjT (DUF2867 family)
MHIAVTGATGNVGRILVRALAEAGEKVTAVSRHPATQSAGVQHRLADLAHPDTVHDAIDGADALFLLVAGAGEGLEPQTIAAAAKDSGIARITLLSSQAAGTRPQAASHAHLRDFEASVQQSGLDWTILRPSGFASNALMWANLIRTERAVAAPFGDIGLPVVDPADIAMVAAATLRHDSHHGHTYVLTGPMPVTPRDQAQAIGDALGEPIEFLEQTRDQAREQMLDFMPEIIVDSTLSILGEPLPTERQVSPHVEAILGRPPHTFADWVDRNVSAFS